MPVSLQFMDSAPLAPSLTIDILNKESIKGITKTRFGGTLPSSLTAIPPDRLRGDFLKRDAIWGISAAGLDSSPSVGTVTALVDDEVIFYIAPLGHGAGFSEEAPGHVLFTETRLFITVTDLAHGGYDSVMFKDFTLPEGSPGRYVRWAVDGADRDLFSATGMHGIYLVTLTEDSNFYTNQEWSEELELPWGMGMPDNESYTLIEAYWWRQALKDIDDVGGYRNTSVLSNAGVVIQPMDLGSHEPAWSVFDTKTRLPSFELVEGGRTVELTNDEKDLVIMDNSLGLLSSQIPILPADSPLAPALPIGMATSVPTVPWENETAVRERAYPPDPPQPPSRTFTLTGTAACFNTHTDLSALTSDRNQAGAVLRDPATVLAMTPDGSALESVMDGGVGIPVRGLESTGMSVPMFLGHGDVVSVPFGKDGPRVDEMSILLSSTSVTIRIDSLHMPEVVTSICYKVGLDNKAYSYFTDTTGLSRSCSFSLAALGWDVGMQSVINAEVSVLDPEGNPYNFEGSRVIPLETGKVYISGVQAIQRDDGSGVVEISYDCRNSFREAAPVTVALSVSHDGGQTFGVPVLSAKGDLGSQVTPGTDKRILWWPAQDIPGSGGDTFVARISAYTYGYATVSGESLSGAFSVDQDPVTASVTLDPHNDDRYGAFSGDDIKGREIPVSGYEYFNQEWWMVSSSSSSSQSSVSSPFSFWVSSSSSSSSRSQSSVSSLSSSSSSP